MIINCIDRPYTRMFSHTAHAQYERCSLTQKHESNYKVYIWFKANEQTLEVVHIQPFNLWCKYAPSSVRILMLWLMYSITKAGTILTLTASFKPQSF